MRVQAEGGTPFACHRVVLAAGSTTLRGLLTSTMRDKAAPALPEVPAAAFQHCVTYIYTGECEAEERMLPELLRAANFLSVEALKAAAVGALQERLDPVNVLQAWALGDQFAAPALAAAAKETALARFEELGDSLSAAPLEQVEALVADERLGVQSEEAVFSAAARWAEAQQPAPAEGAVLELMRHVRFARMRLEFVQQTVKPWPMLQSSACKEMLLDALVPDVGVAAPAARVGMGPRAVYALGGFDDSKTTLSSIEVYDAPSNAWAAGAAMGSARADAAAAVLGGKLYVLGGIGGGVLGLTRLNTAEAFDPRSGAWAAVAPMSTARSCLAAAALGGRLYAIGGQSSSGSQLSSVEAFDPQSGRWAAVAPMSTKRSACGAAVLGGKIYVGGGWNDDNDSLSTVDVYDPATNSWAAAAPMSTKRVFPGVAVLGGKIYVAGGCPDDDTNILSTVEAYNPQTNTWAAVTPMSTPRHSFALAAVRGKLCAVGGYESEFPSNRLATAEMYDPQTERWEAVAPMSGPRSCHAMAAL